MVLHILHIVFHILHIILHILHIVFHILHIFGYIILQIMSSLACSTFTREVWAALGSSIITHYGLKPFGWTLDPWGGATLIWPAIQAFHPTMRSLGARSSLCSSLKLF
jgi:hypothetical protein